MRGTSPDGTKLILCGASRDFAIYDLTAGKVTQSLTAQESIYDASYSPDGTLLAIAEWRDGFTLRDASSLQVLDRFKGSGGLGAWQPRFRPDGKRLTLYSWWHSKKQFWSYDLATRKEIGWPAYEQVDQPTSSVRERFGKAGDYLLSVERERKKEGGRATGFRVWVTDPQNGKIVNKLELQNKDHFQYDISPDGRRAIILQPGELARVVDLETGKSVADLDGHENWVACAAFSPDGRFIVTASGDAARRYGGSLTKKRAPRDASNHVILHDAETGHSVAVLGHRDVKRSYYKIGFSRDSRYIHATTDDKEVIVWGRLPSIPWRTDPLPNYDEKYDRQ